MPEFLRSLVFVLIAAAPALYVGGKIAVPIIGLAEFRLWRNCWLLATVITFLSRGFFDFAVAMAFVSFLCSPILQAAGVFLYSPDVCCALRAYPQRDTRHLQQDY
ncbi:hypothetical protein LZK73_20640 [Neorhizobium galegae]|nr:hypothetical protein LZK73_20640 [Neorhizobium galegae]